MRTTIDLPDEVFRQLKARAALEGLSMKTMVLAFIEHGLRAPAAALESAANQPLDLPTLDGRPDLPPHAWSNAGLFELLDAPAPSSSDA